MKHFTFISLCLVFSYNSLFAQIADRAEDVSPLLIGETIPSIDLTAPDSTLHNIFDIISEKPTVILIYRGGWCPYCNAHLSDIQKVQGEVIKLGFQIVAISPDSPEKLQITDNKDKLDYSLFSDADGTFIKLLGIVFNAPERYTDKLNSYSGGKNNGFLPVPSVFVVDVKGNILFEYISPNYKIRISSGLLMSVLKVLKNTSN